MILWRWVRCGESLPRYGRWVTDFGTIRMNNPPPGPVTAEKEQD